MREPAIGSYHDADGARHELVVRETNEGDWEVLDVVGAETSQVVDRLAGDQDGRTAGRGDRPRLPQHRRPSPTRDGTGGRRAHT